MAQQAALDMFELEGSVEQRIILQIDLPDRQVICRPPIGIHLLQEIG